MVETSSSRGPSDLVIKSGATSGLSVNLHPLPILNVSEHHTRARLTSSGSPKLIGALLGSQANRDVSIVNSFELTYGAGEGNDDITMGESTSSSGFDVNREFLETRREQFKQVFPTLELVGWYSVGEEPTVNDISIHNQFASLLDTPIFLLFSPTPVPGSQELPIKVYEAALGASAESGARSGGAFVELEYGIETGEAERIAVDGVSRGGMGDGGGESSVIGNLVTQRNAIRMLYERLSVLSTYVSAVINRTAAPDRDVLRQISSLVSTLPTINAAAFKEELITEYTDVQLTSYLTALTQQLDSLTDYADKHHVVFPSASEEHGGRGSRGFTSMDVGGRRRR